MTSPNPPTFAAGAHSGVIIAINIARQSSNRIGRDAFHRVHLLAWTISGTRWNASLPNVLAAYEDLGIQHYTGLLAVDFTAFDGQSKVCQQWLRCFYN